MRQERDEFPPIHSDGTLLYTSATVRVMRSYDYNHFEISLTAEVCTIDQTNDLRKQAALLVDEAVLQYKEARQHETNREAAQWKIREAEKNLAFALETPESERTPQQAAIVMSHEAGTYWKGVHEDDYLYDDLESSFHFSMLRKFKHARVSAGLGGSQ